MKKLLIISGLICIVHLFSANMAVAGPDFYAGDISIYGGNTGNIQPNVLIILDTSGSMQDEAVPGNPYGGHAVDYTTNADGTSNNGCGSAPCPKDHVYKCAAWGLECGNWVDTITSINLVTTSCGGSNPNSTLTKNGMWNSSSKKLSNAGVCANGSGMYATGNWINWRSSGGPVEPKINIAKRVLKNLVDSTQGVKFGLMVFNNNQGGTIFSATVGASTYVATVKDMDAIFSGTTTNRNALLSSIDGIVANSWTPLAESLFEAMRYYQGGSSAFANTVGLTGGRYTSPITSSCQTNFVIIITDGMSTQDSDNVLTTICGNGDCDKDGMDPANDPQKNYQNQGSDYLDDVAWYMYHTDMVAAYPGSKVTTYTVGFGLGGANPGAVKLLNETAANGAKPVGMAADGTPIPQAAFMANNETQLTTALQGILGKLMEVNTSFVAPAVPVSPENKLYSGSRIYMGFFKPASGSQWLGNMKKYGLNDTNSIVDADNKEATDATTGAFKPDARSFWSTAADGGEVGQGGVGERLNDRNLVANPRMIYTYKGVSFLTDASNAFIKSNITRTDLGVATDAAKDKLVDYIAGFDAYDVNADGFTNVNRGGIAEQWLMGEILHSKPSVVYYNQYSMSQEADCSVNNTLIFVGANDGRLYAFRDCNGEEAWSFIPPDLLRRLRYITGTKHLNLVDGSPVVYRSDANKDGIVNGGDKVLLMFGERRGGGSDGLTPDSGTGGSYYLLDITDPASPKLVWQISKSVPDTVTFAKLAETYSEPRFIKMKYGTTNKLAAVIGGGYDNLNEDNRYGATQTFVGNGVINGSDLGLTGTSTGLLTPFKPAGNTIYIVDVADLDSTGNPSIGATSGSKLNEFQLSDNYSVPSDIAPVDTDSNGYIDRLYFGDTGGNIWRWNIGEKGWAGAKIFSLNGTSKGRKIFYKPAVSVQSAEKVRIYVGSGDREHPLNTAVVDRMYGLWDKGQATAQTEGALMDVTDNALQLAGTNEAQRTQILKDLEAGYGWYIRLETTGEKALAGVRLFNGAAYFTTYAPNSVADAASCGGNIGIGSIYALNYLTGEAVVNYYSNNDFSSTDSAGYKSLYSANSRATPNGLTPEGGTAGTGVVLQKEDRKLRLPTGGIPSGMVIINQPKPSKDPLDPKKDCAAGFVGAGGSLYKDCVPNKMKNFQLYWRMK